MTTQAAEWIGVSVSGIRMSQDGQEWQRSYVMVLAEHGGHRELPIWIGPAEAIVMAMSLESAETPRPFTHKLAASLVGAAGARITEVRITRLAEDVFYALVVVDGPAGRREVDARPSDAVNLALATGAPIRVEARLFAAALTEQRAGELASLPVATPQIAVQAQRRIRKRGECLPRPAEPQANNGKRARDRSLARGQGAGRDPIRRHPWPRRRRSTIAGRMRQLPGGRGCSARSPSISPRPGAIIHHRPWPTAMPRQANTSRYCASQR